MVLHMQVNPARDTCLNEFVDKSFVEPRRTFVASVTGGGCRSGRHV